MADKFMRDYRNLEVWQLARRFAVQCYQVTASFPADERFGLMNQIRRCGCSVAGNIAEGAGRDSDPDFLRFVRMALGSLNEAETYFLISSDLGFLAPEELSAVETSSRNLGVRLRNFAAKLQATVQEKESARKVRAADPKRMKPSQSDRPATA